MTRPLAIGALLASATACSGLLGLDSIQYDVGDASAPPADATLAGDAPGESGVVDGGCGADGYRAAVMMDDPVAYFRLSDPGLPPKQRCHNEVAGSTYTCTYSTSGLTFGSKGENACAPVVHLSSAGSVTLADANGVLEFVGDVPFSIEAWLEPDAVDGSVPLVALASAMMFSPTNGLDNGYLMSIDGIGPGPREEMWVGGKLGFYSQLVGLPVASAPFHLVLVHSSVDHLDHLYMDGANSGQDHNAGMVAPAQALRPASGKPLQWTGFAGTLGELAIYDKALTLAQITAHFNAGGT